MKANYRKTTESKQVSRENAGAEIRRLRREIELHNYLYYSRNEPQISDEKYDELFRRLQELEQQFPEFSAPDSPTKRVGTQPVSYLKKVKHTAPMLSLAAVLQESEVKDFLDYVDKHLSGRETDYVLEPKIDGFSTEIVYQNSRFVYGATRGDGFTGEDISHNLKMIRGLPMSLANRESIPALLAVRGEVFLAKEDFLKLNEQRLEQGEEPLANPRNAAAGLMRQLDPQEVADKALDIIFYDILKAENLQLSTHWQELNKLAAWGLKTGTHNKLGKSLEEITAYYHELAGKRAELSYEIDGIVIKVNQLTLHGTLGTRERNPRWALAWKFQPKREITTLKEIIVQVGRTGILTPVALLEPVNVGGVTVSRATLHNEDEIHKKDIRTGDQVRIIRAGDVIPEVAASLTAASSHKQPANQAERSEPFKMPAACPVCRTAVIKEGAYYYCPAGLYCRAQLAEHVIHYSSKAAMNIEGLGEKLSKQLIERQWVKRIPDLYRLTPADFLALPGFKEKRAYKLYQAIQNSKRTSLERFLYALGIRHVGQYMAKLLAGNFGTLQAVLAAKYDDFIRIPAVGAVTAHNLEAFFDKKENDKTIQALLDLGVEPGTGKRLPPGEQSLKGKTFVFTGKLAALTRAEAKEKVVALGGRVAERPGVQTDLVVAGKNTGSKWTAARKRKLKIITEEEFLNMVGGQGMK